MKHRIEMETEQSHAHKHPLKKETAPKMAAPAQKTNKVAAKSHRKTSPK